VLHRRYLCLARRDPRYEYSRRTCIDAATQTLRFQFELHREIQPGGRLAEDRWFMNSLSLHDFLLANMILCLELAFLKAKEKSPDATALALEEFDKDKTPDVLSKQQIVEMLRTSRLIWQSTRKGSHEANRAFKILSRMLAASIGSDIGDSPLSSGSGERLEYSEVSYADDAGKLMAFATQRITPPMVIRADCGYRIGSHEYAQVRGCWPKLFTQFIWLDTAE